MAAGRADPRASGSRSRATVADPTEGRDARCNDRPSAGEPVDVSELYRSELPRLRGWLALRLPHDRAADLVQAAFARLLGLGSERIAKLDQPRAYLTRIAGNLVRDEARMAMRRARDLHVNADDYELAAADTVAALEARDMLVRVDAALQTLPDRTREIFMAHRFEEMTYPEIAARMGVSVKTVEKHISLALRHLHRSLGEGA
ncbi:RNA polymerase sigma factor [Novosphingobium malaysiense]|uniref:RNA polymerase sigma factor n=1 Tax=Novosphingobium malaysiense TaxID=1348853 RepID=UPI00068E9690|nr:sigma-70 family RNA polymerase sigma factor [Novosphingobium malaysiense]